MGIKFESKVYEVFGWQSIHFFDPDGNSVEFVCYDSESLKIEANNEVRNSKS